MGANWKGFCVLLTAVSWMWATRSPAETPYRTKNVIIVSMDGVRYSETFGDPRRELIPNVDAKAHSFDCTAGPATDGVVLDIRGTGQTTVKMTAEPQGMTFTLGELMQKKAIQAAAPDDQLLQATISQEQRP